MNSEQFKAAVDLLCSEEFAKSIEYPSLYKHYQWEDVFRLFKYLRSHQTVWTYSKSGLTISGYPSIFNAQYLIDINGELFTFKIKRTSPVRIILTPTKRQVNCYPAFSRVNSRSPGVTESCEEFAEELTLALSSKIEKMSLLLDENFPISSAVSTLVEVDSALKHSPISILEEIDIHDGRVLYMYHDTLGVFHLRVFADHTIISKMLPYIQVSDILNLNKGKKEVAEYRNFTLVDSE